MNSHLPMFDPCKPDSISLSRRRVEADVTPIPEIRLLTSAATGSGGKCLLLTVLLTLMCVTLFAQRSPSTNATVRFQALDIYLDSKDKPLAAYQLEFKATAGDVKIVGIEGGEHPTFREAPFYDPQAMQRDRVIIAAFSTEPAGKLPTGKTRLATVHVQIGANTVPQFELKLHTAADSSAKKIIVEASFVERKSP